MSVAVLVLSCDKYSPYWAGWHHHWAKHWKVRDVPVYFATEAKQVPEWPGVSPIYVGRDMTWSGCLLMALSKIKADTVFFSLEDYWPTMDMGQDLWDELYQEYTDRGLFCLRCSHPCPYYKLDQDGRMLSTSQYLVSCQTSFWHKKFLESVIEKSESPWQFELDGTERVRAADLSPYVAFHPLPWYAHVCVRGKFVEKFKCLTTHNIPDV